MRGDARVRRRRSLAAAIFLLLLVACEHAAEPPPSSPVRGELRNTTPGRSDPGLELPSPLPHRPGTTLKELDVSGSQISVRPDFRPQIRRYAVYPATDPASLEVRAIPQAPTDQVMIDGQPTAGPTRVQVRPGDRIQIRISHRGMPTTGYELIVLPLNFPVFDVSLLDPSHASRGPVYVSVNSSLSGCAPPDGCWLVRLDAFGVPLSVREESDWTSDYKLQPTGERSYQVLLSQGSAPEGAVNIIGSTGETEQVGATAAAGPTNIHDFLALPDGRRVFVAYRDDRRSPSGGAQPLRIVDGVIEEQTPDGEVAFTWNSGPAVPVGDSQRPPPDYFHLNSVAAMPDGDYLVSARGPSQVYRIDRDTGEVLWRLGGTTSDFRFRDDPLGGICGQHTAVPLPGSRVLVFDNGQAASIALGRFDREPVCPPLVEASGRGKTTRAAEYALDVERGIARLVWSYDSDVYSPAQGSVQRLPNGNTFIGWGQNDAGLLATEVTPSGDVVFEVSATWPDGVAAVSYRAYRFGR